MRCRTLPVYARPTAVQPRSRQRTPEAPRLKGSGGPCKTPVDIMVGNRIVLIGLGLLGFTVTACCIAKEYVVIGQLRCFWALNFNFWGTASN